MAIMDNTCDSRWDYNVDPLNPTEWPGRIHGGRKDVQPGTADPTGGSNVLFCDGHVQWYTQQTLVNVIGNDPAQVEMRRMWNNDNEPH